MGSGLRSGARLQTCCTRAARRRLLEAVRSYLVARFAADSAMVGRGPKGPKRSKSADSVVAESIASTSFTLQQVATHSSASDCWMVINRKVGGD